MRREPFRPGAHIEARWNGGDWPYPGVVARVNDDGVNISYDLQYDDGVSENGVPAENVMTPNDLRARNVEWRRIGTWVEIDGKLGTIIGLLPRRREELGVRSSTTAPAAGSSKQRRSPRPQQAM